LTKTYTSSHSSIHLLNSDDFALITTMSHIACIQARTPGKAVNITFRQGQSYLVNDPEDFFVLGIYYELENWLPIAPNQHFWGVPKCTSWVEYDKRPRLTVLSPIEQRIAGTKRVLLRNEASNTPLVWRNKVTVSTTNFESSVFSIGASVSINAGVNIGVVSANTTVSTNFNSTTERRQTVETSTETEVTLYVERGTQAVAVPNPTFISTFRINLNGMYGGCYTSPENRHIQWKGTYSRDFNCEIEVRDVGSVLYIVEAIPGFSGHGSVNNLSYQIGFAESIVTIEELAKISEITK
jgi:hypothetical protein